MTESKTNCAKEPVGSGEREIQQGECLVSIAAESGHLWQTIWDDPANSDLRANRDPNILLPGDRIHVPPIREKTETCATDKRHTFVRSDAPGVLRIVVEDMDEPLASQPYELWVDGTCLKGSTDSQGRLTQAVPLGAKEGRLIVGSGDEMLVYELALGSLDPISTVAGIQGRLRNLGYNAGTAGEIDEQTTAAVAAFCADHEIPIPDDLTGDTNFLDRVESVHGF